MRDGKGPGSDSLAETTRLSKDEFVNATTPAAGAVKPRRVSLLIYSRDGVQVVPLVEEKPLVIGRHSPADITVRDSSLSRQHASAELIDGDVWIEDLQSTNGTWVDGERVERAKLDANSEVMLGAVTLALHTVAPSESRRLGLDSHDHFQQSLHAEVKRIGALGGRLAMMMFQGEGALSRWSTRLRDQLRAFDTLALYSGDTVEVIRPGDSIEQALELAEKVVGGQGAARCGIALFPDHAGSAEQLAEVTRTALREATSAVPTNTAPTPHDVDASSEPVGPVVHSSAMRALYRTVKRLGSSAIPVLILGETGTGKEVVARVIHKESNRAQRPFLCVNCGSIPPQLVESTLFGHEKGAFTGANHQAKGVFESAHGGSVLLDEIGELPLPAQAALLRVLESKVITRVGSTKEIEVDVRILAATHRNLESMCDAGTFRQDLFYRLNVMTLKIPPLRERTDEVDPLARSLVQQGSTAAQRDVRGIDDDALQLLLRYRWPGNVRELRNVMERAVVIARGPMITVEDLPEQIRELEHTADLLLPEAPGKAPDEDLGSGGEVNLRAEVQRFEAGLIMEALRNADWDRKTAARALGLPLRTLAHKIQLHDLKKD